MFLRSNDNWRCNSFPFTILYSTVWTYHNLLIILLMDVCFFSQVFLWRIMLRKHFFTYLLVYVPENFSKIYAGGGIARMWIKYIFTFLLTCFRLKYFPKCVYQSVSHQHQVWAPFAPCPHLTFSDFYIWFISSLLLQIRFFFLHSPLIPIFSCWHSFKTYFLAFKK